MSEQAKNDNRPVEEKMKELFDLMDEKAAAGELHEVEGEQFDQKFKQEMEESMTPMSASEVAGIEYSMMMNQFEALLADWERREAEEKAEKAKAKAEAAGEQE